MKKVIDLRTDAATLPTPEMRRAMHDAEVGNDFYGEDPTVRRLEDRTAEMLGKDASLLVSTSTMGNIVSVLAQTRRGESIIGDDKLHIFVNQGVPLAIVCGVVPRTTHGDAFDEAALKAAVSLSAMDNTPSKLLCTENTHNAAGGRCLSPEQTRLQCSAAKTLGLRVHLDGARLFNAAVALDVRPSALVEGVDSTTLGITKGLGCPVGALVAGEKEFIAEARHWRYVVGGAMSQAGCFAAAGLVAFDRMVERLAEDHANAKRLAAAFMDLGLHVNPAEIETNIVFIDVDESLYGAKFVHLLRDRGVLVNPPNKSRIRFVTHFGVTREDIDQTALQVSMILKSITPDVFRRAFRELNLEEK